MKQYILDENLNPVECEDLTKWATWMGSPDRVVARTEVGDVLISTVFLGLDSRSSLTGPPMFYETMIFGGVHDQYKQRYATRDEAVAMHKWAVEQVEHVK